MFFWMIIKSALASLMANKLRSMLAMLGIIIGVGAVIAMLAIAAAAQKQVMDRFSAMGTNLLIITPRQRGSGGVMSGTQQNLTLEDAAAIVREVPNVRAAAPLVSGRAQVKYFGRNANTTVTGTSITYLSLRNFEVEFGRAMTEQEVEGMSRVAIIGPTTAQNLIDDPASAVGQIIKVKGINFRVVGVLKAKGDQGWFNPDDQVIVPYTTAMKQLFGLTSLREIDVAAEDEKMLTQLQVDLLAILRKRHRLVDEADDDVRIRSQAETLAMASDFTRTFAILLGSIAGISLFVGGIGIMNIMLATVTERTREIGIRKAIGAKNRDILSQFIIEAVIMSGLGGLIGVGGGVAAARTIAYLTRFSTVVQIHSILLALTFAAAVGIFFGFYPARRAAILDPIEALRYE